MNRLATEFAKIYEDNYAYVRSVFLRKFRSIEMAEDLTHDTFAAAWKAFPRYEYRATPRTWLTRIASNMIINQIRYTKAQKNFAACVYRLNDDEVKIDIGKRGSTADINMALAEAIESLSYTEREAFNLQYREGMSHEEMSEILGVAVSAIKSRSLRARNNLRPQLWMQNRELTMTVLAIT